MFRIKQSGFTIIELLIVIVVIGILAAITLVAYNGVTNRAKVATLQSDLTNARDTLAIANTQDGVYPVDLSAAQAAGLKASSGTTYQYSHVSPEGYCLTATNSGMSYYVDTSDHNAPTIGTCPGDVDGGGSDVIADGTIIQTITADNCPSTRTRAVDARDNRTYWVQKLADGKCWMLTNLAYLGDGTNTYGDTRSLLNGTSNAATTYLTPKYYIPTGANPTTEPTDPSTSTNGTGQYGYLYNWCAAMGGQVTAACNNAATPTPNQSISVCPAGWRLPTGNGGELGALNTAVNGGSIITDAGLRNAWLAQYSGAYLSFFGDQGATGWYWSSLQDNADYAYNLSFDSGLTFSGNYNSKYQGSAVRCLAN